MTVTKTLNADHLTTTDELYGFRDSVSGMWLRFYTPARRFDLWQQYVAGAQRTYQKYRVEAALSLPAADEDATTPVFCVMSDDGGTIWAGWYANGPLRSMRDAYAPREFVSEPLSASMVTSWISDALPDGVIELKGAWVDPASDQKGALADLTSRAFLHAMTFLGVRFAYCSAAEHAAPRWFNSGARELPDIVPAAYPDDRYRTTLLTWDAETTLDFSTSEQRQLFGAERRQAVGHGDERAW
ncbi:hypothetical protein CLV30_1376 [Haloactinopolyspora alba]|uniref:N-acetyltransferase domain-containing protein n=1 Tax=Haloactinopolyspora alba TaxID=648780 RepID=A0A2P8D1D6_9ACTN|nr:hypothetical protein [Haloactinopolyspora alba]PSK90986.1 hypothetical protein CLV30_1376 [Haloactinopolyspora alba]